MARLHPRVTLVALALVISGPLAAAAVEYLTPPEDYASYQPQQTCRSTPLPGTKQLAGWINRQFSGGTAVASIRRCGSGGTSEHKDGRAIDWSMRAGNDAQRREVGRFKQMLFAVDAEGYQHALARRMGVMYIIWNDHIYSSYRQFERRDYRPCARLRDCSATQRHRDHVHISLSRPGGRGETSWYGGTG